LLLLRENAAFDLTGIFTAVRLDREITVLAADERQNTNDRMFAGHLEVGTDIEYPFIDRGVGARFTPSTDW